MSLEIIDAKDISILLHVEDIVPSKLRKLLIKPNDYCVVQDRIECEIWKVVNSCKMVISTNKTFDVEYMKIVINSCNEQNLKKIVHKYICTLMFISKMRMRTNCKGLLQFKQHSCFIIQAASTRLICMGQTDYMYAKEVSYSCYVNYNKICIICNDEIAKIGFVKNDLSKVLQLLSRKQLNYIPKTKSPYLFCVECTLKHIPDCITFETGIFKDGIPTFFQNSMKTYMSTKYTRPYDAIEAIIDEYLRITWSSRKMIKIHDLCLQ